jgi:hypothetical protein
MSGFTQCASGARAPAPDPSKRVNFVHGLVLGADELTQESAFLAGRAEWLARELIGYGTVSGLRVSHESLTDGPVLIVSSGVAVTPRGRPVRVSMAQAVALNQWLDAHRHDVIYHLVPGFESPPGDMLRLYVVLCYRQCATDNRPGPGEPCRTDDAPQIYTRLADDFALELRLGPPDQREDTAVRELTGWLRRIEIVDTLTATATRDELLDALRAAAVPGSPPDGTLSSPPEGLRVHTSDVCDLFRAAFNVWATELRPLSHAPSADDDCVLLCDVELPVVPAPNGRWTVAEDSRIALLEDRRPYVLPLRLLQELALCDRAQTRTGSIAVAAAGIIAGDATNTSNRRPVINGLRVVNVANGELTFTFDGYVQPAVVSTFQYVVKALSQARPSQPAAPVIVNLGGFDPDGIRLRLTDATGVAIPVTDLASIEISIEVTRYVS